MSHQADFIHVICTDPRIQKLYHDWLVTNDLFGKFDTIQFENPILAFLNPNTQIVMLDRISVYIKLHNPHKVIFIDHFDCGAYKLFGFVFTDFSSEIKKHVENNNIVKDIIIKSFPQLEVEIKYINLTGNQCEWLEKPENYY